MSDQEPPGGSARGSLPLGRATDEEESDESSDEEDVNELPSAQLNPVHTTKVAHNKKILEDSSNEDSDIEVLLTQSNVPRRKSVEKTLSNTNDRPGPNLPSRFILSALRVPYVPSSSIIDQTLRLILYVACFGVEEGGGEGGIPGRVRSSSNMVNDSAV
jgi:hypothetical protein